MLIAITPDVITTKLADGTVVPRILGYWLRIRDDMPRIWLLQRESAITVLEQNARGILR